MRIIPFSRGEGINNKQVVETEPYAVILNEVKDLK